MNLVPYALARRVGDVLDDAAVPWTVVGSLASSIHGLPRSTADIDLVAALALDDLDAVVGALEPMGYVDRGTARDAVAAGRSFNLIDHASMQKVDVFCVRGPRAGQIERSVRVEVAPGLVLPVQRAEDTIVEKLRWFRLGGEVSDRQRNDVLEVLRVQGPAIDRELLDALADEAGVRTLLDAFRAA